MSINPTAASAAMEASLSEQVAEEVRALLGRRRMSGRQLATAMGVSPSWINYRLTGRQPIDLNDMQKMARALGVPVIQLLPADLRSMVRVAYPVTPGPGPKPNIRGPLTPGRSAPPTFGQRSSTQGQTPTWRKIITRPAGHPISPLWRAA